MYILLCVDIFSLTPPLSLSLSLMNENILILVSGWAESGKDTLVNHLIQKHGFERFAFADKLKDMSCEPYEVDRNNMDDTKLKATPLLHYPVKSKDEYTEMVQNSLKCHFRTAGGVVPNAKEHTKFQRDSNGVLSYNQETLYWTPRAILVLEGSTKRTVTPSYWADKSKIMKQHKRVAISDWRYLSEIEDTKLIFSDYTVIPLRVDVDTEPISNDPSERGLDNYPHFFARILNEKNGLEKYHQDIETTLAPILGHCKN